MHCMTRASSSSHGNGQPDLSKGLPPHTRVRARALRYRESATDKGGNA